MARKINFAPPKKVWRTNQLLEEALAAPSKFRWLIRAQMPDFGHITGITDTKLPAIYFVCSSYILLNYTVVVVPSYGTRQRYGTTQRLEVRIGSVA